MSRGLTGGTRDVNPQFYKIAVTQSAADTTTSQAFPLPVPKLQSNTRPVVVELLKVFWNGPGAAEVDSNLYAILSTKNYSTTIPALNDGAILAAMLATRYITTSGTFANVGPFMQDLTDGAGHGILVATDNVYLQVSSAGTSAANTVTAWLLYRMKEVALAEYIGIVQSQQT